MLDLLLLSVYALFAFVGLRRPYIACMGYLWVNLVRPQSISYGFLSNKPVSMIMAIVCIVSLVANFHKLKLPKSYLIPVLMIMLLIWVTLTTLFVAWFPEHAWVRWGYAVETILICLIIPLTISKVCHLESIIITWLFSVAYFVLSTGIKTMASGGGYGYRFVLNYDAPLSESSLLATMAVGILPFIFFLYKRSVVFMNSRLIKLFWILLCICCIFTIVGSYARTGILSLATYLFILLMRTKRKVLYSISLVIIISIGFVLVPENYKSRMNTMTDAGKEASALGRLLVWKWTFNFVKKNPFGGGFESYYANEGLLIDRDNPVATFHKAKAYHNIFIQMLGEHGYIGLFLYISMLIAVFLKLNYLKKYSRGIPDSGEWMSLCAQCAITSLIILHVGGMFIGVAYQISFLYLSIVITLSLEKVYHRERDIAEMRKEEVHA